MSDNKKTPDDKKIINEYMKTENNLDDKIIKILEDELASVKDTRKEERFVWILTTMILFDMLVFESAQSWGFPIAILVLQIILLAIIARKFGIQEFNQLLDKLLDSFKKN